MLPNSLFTSISNNTFIMMFTRSQQDTVIFMEKEMIGGGKKRPNTKLF